jgi:hypothetical protein
MFRSIGAFCAALAMTALLLKSVAVADVDKCCNPAGLSEGPPTAPAGSSCSVTIKIQGLVKHWICGDSNPPNCSGSANQTADPFGAE